MTSKRRQFVNSLAIVGVTLCLLLPVPACTIAEDENIAQAGKGGDAGPAKPQLSAEAAAAVKKVYPAATIKWVGIEAGGEPCLFKVVLQEGKAGREVEVSSDGVLVSTQIDVAAGDLPKSVRAAIEKATAGGKIRKIEREDIFARMTSNGTYVKLKTPTVIYEAKFAQDGAAKEVKIAAGGEALGTKTKGWRRIFGVDKKNLVTVGRNPYFILIPGYKLHLKGGNETVVISVLADTKVVDGVETRVVEERETKNGKLVEVSRNYFAIDETTKDVYYFGEDVDIYRRGKIVAHGGAWLSGVKGAKFGLIMPGKPVTGDKYYQEIAPKNAMDRAENANLNATLKTPLKTFSDVLYVRETSPLEAGDVSHKWYAPGVGMIGDDELRLIKTEGPAK